MKDEITQFGRSWEFEGNMFNVKEEPHDDTRNDSGVTSGSECPSASPNSERSVVSPTTRPWYPHPPTPEPKLLDECRVPKVNSHGKVKVHKCKQCEFFAYTKLEFWEHSGVHIKGDKILKCPTCPFVTEYKHHLEYHLLNHAGAKPFKCDHCDYTCVNKSMLKSHLKSHSKVYQYRCANCHYETKYCHSLKLHLRKYNHKPAMVLNPDGTPNPLPVIDVYGTRRGPKVKKQEASPPQQPSMVSPILPPFPLPLIPPNELMMNFQNMFRERLEEMAKQIQPPQSGALDLSQKTPQSSEHGDDDDTMTTAFDNVEAVVDPHNNNKFDCPQCDLAFGDEIMFRIHMGYHGYQNPFTCNMCGEECENKVKFFLHIAKAAH